MNPSKLAGTLWTLPVREWKNNTPFNWTSGVSGLPSFFVKGVTEKTRFNIVSENHGIDPKQVEYTDYDLEVIFRLYNRKHTFLGRWSNRIYLHCNCRFSTLDNLIKSLPYSNDSTKKRWQLEDWKKEVFVSRLLPEHWGDFVPGGEKLLGHFMENYASVRFADEGMVRDSNKEYKRCYHRQEKNNDCDGWIDKILHGKVPDFSTYTITLDRNHWDNKPKEEASETAIRYGRQAGKSIPQSFNKELLEAMKKTIK